MTDIIHHVYAPKNEEERLGLEYEMSFSGEIPVVIHWYPAVTNPADVVQAIVESTALWLPKKIDALLNAAASSMMRVGYEALQREASTDLRRPTVEIEEADTTTPE